MQARTEFGDELAEIFLAFVWDFLKINDQSRVMVLYEILDCLLRQILSRRAALEQGRHFVGQPVGAVGIVDQRHRGNFDRRILLLQRLQPGRQLGIFFHIEPARGRDRVQALRDEQVNVAEVLLERRKGSRIPAHIKSGANRIVGCGHLAE
jgi:hypothetical protein